MPKGAYGLSPIQKVAQRRSLEEIMAEAEALPSPTIARTVDDMQPLIKKLRDTKGLSWNEIQFWMQEHTEFARSGAFWKQIYSGKRMKLTAIEVAVAPTLSQPRYPEIKD